jgi:hypothetical protein
MAQQTTTNISTEMRQCSGSDLHQRTIEADLSRAEILHG